VRRPIICRRAASSSAPRVITSSASPRAPSSLAGSSPSSICMAAICLFVNAAKGASALQLCRRSRRAVQDGLRALPTSCARRWRPETAELRLSNTVEVDGAYFGGHVSPGQPQSRPRRSASSPESDRQAGRSLSWALREAFGRGGRCARSFRLESDGIAFARERIIEGSVVAADDLRHCDVLASSFTMERIDHSEAYTAGTAPHTNLAESYFALS